MTTPPGDTDAPLVLVTGAQGFVGVHVVASLARKRPHWRVDAPPSQSGPSGEPSLDITDAAAVEAWVRARPPATVLHLAGVSAVTATEKDPRRAWRVNLDGTLNLVLALQRWAPHAHLVMVSSAEVYGASLNAGRPVDETALLQPVNPYAASKGAADMLVRQAAAAGLATTVLRPFNHTGPGQSEAFVAPSFAAQIARIEAGLQAPVLSVGSLDDERDFLDVEDVVCAYVAVMDARDRLGDGQVFNVASGRPLRIGDILQALLAKAHVPIEVRTDPQRLRRTPIARVVGDAGRLRAALGWAPRVDLSDTFQRVLEDRRRIVAAGLPPGLRPHSPIYDGRDEDRP